MDSTDAVILVGGMGTRLRPLTLSVPKPMIPTAGAPFLAHLIARIRAAGIEHIVLGTSYRAEVFESAFGDGSSMGVELEYVVETEPLGTAGGIRNVADRLRGDTTLIFNGDVLTGVDLRALTAAHHETDADVTLYLTKVADPRQFGCVPTDEFGRVLAFLEKDPAPQTDQINAGTYVFRRDLIDRIPAGRPVSVERETFPGLLADGVRICGYVDTSYWRDLGRPADYVAGSADLVQGLAPSPLLPGPPRAALVLDGASVAADARLSGGSTIGPGCTVGAGAVVDGSVLLDGASVADGAVVCRSVLGFGATVGAGSVVADAVIGDRAQLGSGIELRAGARVWPDVVLPDGSIRFSSDL
jgi:mannose-1-phosphate guanylyltransferase